MRLTQLRRIRWAVRITLTLGVAASVMANVLHAQPNVISQAIAAWPPLALLLTVELISRVPVDRRSLAAARLLATATIAGIAAWVSYWHMAGVAARYGETGASPYLMPLSVDGLIIVASVCLVELGGRVSALDAERVAKAEQLAEAERTVAVRRAEAERAVAEERAETARLATAEATRAAEAARAVATAEAARVAAMVPASRLASVPAVGGAMPAANGSTVDDDTDTEMVAVTPRAASPRSKSAAGGASKQRRPMAETAALAAAIQAVQPDVTDADLARQLGISTSRLKTIKREMRSLEPVSPAPATNGSAKQAELAAA